MHFCINSNRIELIFFRSMLFTIACSTCKMKNCTQQLNENIARILSHRMLIIHCNLRTKICISFVWHYYAAYACMSTMLIPMYEQIGWAWIVVMPFVQNLIPSREIHWAIEKPVIAYVPNPLRVDLVWAKPLMFNWILLINTFVWMGKMKTKQRDSFFCSKKVKLYFWILIRNEIHRKNFCEIVKYKKLFVSYAR